MNEPIGPPVRDPIELPKWVKVSFAVLSVAMSLGWALAIMLQWGVWLTVTSQILRPWGGLIGVAIVGIQIGLMFGGWKSKNSCGVYSRGRPISQ